MRLRTPERSLMAALPLRHRLSDTCRSSSSSSRGDNGQAQAQEQQQERGMAGSACCVMRRYQL